MIRPVLIAAGVLTLGALVGASVSLPFCPSPWQPGDLCFEAETFERSRFLTSSSSHLSSSSVSSSSFSSSSRQVVYSSADYKPFVAEPADWPDEEEVTQRCDLTMLRGSSLCIVPDELSGSKIILPATVTRFSKEAFKLCSFEGSGYPAAVVYILDRSGSMTTNDPSDMATAAFRDAIRLQAEIDPQSFAGYIPFSAYVDQRRYTHAALQPLTQLNSVGVTQLVNGIGSSLDPIAGGTSFLGPLRLAAEWLNAPQFDNHQKIILFFSDGFPESERYVGPDPTGYDWSFAAYTGVQLSQRKCRAFGNNDLYCMQDFSYKLIEEGEFVYPAGTSPEPIPAGSIPIPVIHSVYLGDTTAANAKRTEAKMGRGLMDYLSWRTTDSQGREGTFTYLSDPAQMEPILRGLISTYVQSSVPEDFEMHNITTGETVRVAHDNIREQPDGTYTVVMDTTIALIPGINKMELRAKYSGDGEGTTPPRRFEIEVTDRVINEGVVLEGAPFQTDCYDISLLRIYNSDRKRVLYFDRTDTLGYLRMTYPKPEEGSYDRIYQVSLTAQTGDSLRVEIPLVGTIGDLLVYESSFPIDWLVKKRNDDLLQLMTPDSFRAVWRHPVDRFDTLEASQRVLWELRQPDLVSFWDTDHDGVLDSLVSRWPVRPDSIDLARLRLAFDWPGADGKRVTVEIPPEGWSLRKGGMWGVALPEPELLGISTSLPDSASLNLVFESDPGKKEWAVIRKLDRSLLADSMPPIITGASIRASQRDGGIDTLEVLFSEPIASGKIKETPYLEFWTFGGNRYGRPYDEEIGRPRWKGNLFQALMQKEEGFFVEPGDSVRMVPGIRRIQDGAGNTPWIENPFVYIDGDRRRQVEVIPLTTLSASDPVIEGQIEPSFFDGGDDILKELQRDRRIGLMWGPIKVPRDADETTVQIFKWELGVFSNLGGFVASQKGVIDCTSLELRDRCRSEEGIKVFLVEWDKRTAEGRLVGAGAYIMKGNLHGRALLSTVGIRR